MAHVEDRWFTAGRNGRKVKTGRHPDNGGSPAAKRWRVRYAGDDGRERSTSFHRKADAERFRATTEADLVRGTWTDPAGAKITLRDYADAWVRSRSVEENSRAQLASRLRLHAYPVLGDMPLAVIARRPSAIQEWVRGLEVGPRYAGMILSTLSSVLSAAVEDGLIPRNPCKARSVRAPRAETRKVVPWTAERVAAVRAGLLPRYQACADAGAGLGLRCGEMLALSPDDIDWLRGVVHVRRQLKVVTRRPCFAPPKGGKERDVPLSDGVKLRLAEHVRRNPPVTIELPWKSPSGRQEAARLMFTTPRGKLLDPRWFGRVVFIPARRAAGVPDGRDNGFHQLRHYFASTLLANGVDIRALSEYLGHHSPAFTLRVYTHLMPVAGDRMRDAVDRALSNSDGPVSAQDAEKAR